MSAPLVTALLRRIGLCGVQVRLLALTMALGVPFLVYLSASLSQSLEVERQHTQREMLDMAKLTASRLDYQVGDVRTLLVTLSHSIAPVLQDPARVSNVLQGIGPQLSPQINNVSVWTVDGRNIASLRPVPAGGAPSQRDSVFFDDVLKTGKMAVRAPVASWGNGEWVAAFGLPVQLGGKVVGVVVACLRLNGLQALLDPEHALSEGAVITVADDNAVVIYRSLDTSGWIGRTLPGPAPDFSASAGAFERVSVDGVPRSFGHAQLNLLSWRVLVGIRTDVATAPARSRWVASLLIGATMLAFGTLLALWMGQRIARPLRRLGQDAARMGEGVLTHRSPVRGMREIGLLAAALNGMAESLQQRADALAQSRQLLRKVSDHVPALMSLLDRQERILFANDVHQEWLGINPSGLVGRPVGELMTEAANIEVRPHFDAAWSGKRIVYEVDVNTIHGERWMQVTLVPLRLDGKVAELCVMVLDVTERRAARMKLARSEERLNLAIEASGLALFDWDLSTDRIYHSAQAAALRGAPAIEINRPSKELQQFVHPDDLRHVTTELFRTLKGECNAYSVEFRLRHVRGTWVWVRALGRVVERAPNGRALRVAGTYADISERRAADERLRYLAEYDHLTGLPNRALFYDRLHHAVQRALRSGKPMAVMFLDIDHFKRVNDTLGHAAGDDLLKSFAKRLLEGVRKSDTVARLAGDEFTVILEELSHLDDARNVADALVASARRPMVLDAGELNITTSVGVALWTGGDTDGADLMRRADAALYHAKRRGRDRAHMDGQPEPDRVDAALEQHPPSQEDA